MINDLWYKNAVIYCLSVATFMDANGDGVGDFQGLTRRLDYLHGLGITTIWLMPFQPSPYRDDGYDISDYYGVDSRHGTLGDFVEFTHGAEQRGIRVIMDLVVNHTSDRHPWFQEARRDPNSKYRDWYIWSDKKPPNANKGMVFPGVQKSTWSYDKTARAWYFHRFYDFQPDLNTSNPHVQAEILKIMGFWIQLGVIGFRMDAVPFVISMKGPRVKKPVEQYDMLRSLREFLQWRAGDSIILAEANVLPETDMEYFGEDGDRMHMMFNFQVNQNLFYALAAADCRPLVRALKATKPRPATAIGGVCLQISLYPYSCYRSVLQSNSIRNCRIFPHKFSDSRKNPHSFLSHRVEDFSIYSFEKSFPNDAGFYGSTVFLWMVRHLLAVGFARRTMKRGERK